MGRHPLVVPGNGLLAHASFGQADRIPMMVTPHESDARKSLLDEWIAEVGESGVFDVIDDTKRRIAEGSLPGFTEKHELVAYLNRSRRQSA